MSFEDNSDLSKFKKEVSNPHIEPSLKFLAMAVLSIEEACQSASYTFDIVKRLKGFRDAQTYNKVQLQINNYIFDITAFRMLDFRFGMSKALLWVDLHRSERTVRLTKFGSIIYDDDPNYEDSARTWQLSTRELIDDTVIEQTTRILAHVVLTCGIWNARLMGGLMTSCVECPYEKHCLLTPAYLISKKEDLNGNSEKL